MGMRERKRVKRVGMRAKEDMCRVERAKEKRERERERERERGSNQIMIMS